MGGAHESGILKLFERSQGIQALRDGMLRLCDAFLNGAVSKADYIDSGYHFAIRISQNGLARAKAKLDLAIEKRPTIESQSEALNTLQRLRPEIFEEGAPPPEGNNLSP